MPIYVYDCPQGHPRFEGVTTLADHSKCPVCGAEGQKQFVPTGLRIDMGYMDERMDPLERQALLEHKKVCEEGLKKGSMDCKIRGPKEFQPFNDVKTVF